MSDFILFMLIKGAVLCVLAGAYGWWRASKGLPLEGGRSEQQEGQADPGHQDQR